MVTIIDSWSVDSSETFEEKTERIREGQKE